MRLNCVLERTDCKSWIKGKCNRLFITAKVFVAGGSIDIDPDVLQECEQFELGTNRCDICGVAADVCLEGLCGNCHIVLVALVQHGRTMGVKTGRKTLEALVARVRAGKES